MRVARTLGHISGWTLSNLEMQKICYIAEMLYLGREDAPLIVEDWQAWANGPVQPDLYHKAKVFGVDPVRDIFREPGLSEVGDRYKAVSDAYDIMGNFNPGQMVGVTHRRNGAWAQYYRSGLKGVKIPKSAIRAEYSTLINDS